jgi:hypothetical protein
MKIKTTTQGVIVLTYNSREEKLIKITPKITLIEPKKILLSPKTLVAKRIAYTMKVTSKKLNIGRKKDNPETSIEAILRKSSDKD